jgi:hypothetical protein
VPRLPDAAQMMGSPGACLTKLQRMHILYQKFQYLSIAEKDVMVEVTI